MKLTKITLSYTVCSGTSGSYEDFRVNDTLFIDANSEYLKTEEGLDELQRLLLESSVRGGGIGPAQFDDIEMSVHAPKNYRKYPTHLDDGSQYYLSSIDHTAQDFAHALKMHEIRERRVERNPDAIESAQKDLQRQINITAGLSKRYTSYEKMRNEQRKLERIEKRERLLMAQDRPMREISQSEEWRQLQRRKEEASQKVEQMRARRERYASTVTVMKEELRALKDAQKQVEREIKAEEKLLESRFKEVKKQQQKLQTRYSFGEIERPALLNKSDKQIRDEIKRERELELNPALATELERQRIADREAAELQRALNLVNRRGRNERDV